VSQLKSCEVRDNNNNNNNNNNNILNADIECLEFFYSHSGCRKFVCQPGDVEPCYDDVSIKGYETGMAM
jgi:hypothetical protein